MKITTNGKMKITTNGKMKIKQLMKINQVCPH
jgi:hypothetical protein